MRVSIVTPSFNQAKYLEQTIRSVLDSNIPELEYFVMDGGSLDGSVEIIKKYSDRLAGWVSEIDHGQADAINKGLRQSTGDVVAWLNSDDFYLPGAISKALCFFELHPDAGLIYGNVLSVDAAGKTFNLQTFRSYDLVDLMSFHIISQPGVFMRRSILEKAGLLEPRYHLLLDHQLWLRIASLSKIYYVPETLAAARYHPEAKNLSRTADFGSEAFQIVEWMKSDPAFQSLYNKNQNQILGGAHRLNAFYLLDGGFYVQSLKAYWQAFRFNPSVVLKEWYRIIYALLAMAGLKNLRKFYIQIRQWLKTKKLS